MDGISWKKRIAALIIVYVMYLISWNSAFGGDHVAANPIILKGHLSQEALRAAALDIDALPTGSPLVLILNSNSGDLIASLDIAKKIYVLKSEKSLKVIVYIEDNAIGPAAIFPFLADEFDISSFVSWGDIPLGNEKMYQANVLRNKVVSLIDPAASKAQLLRLIASAMTDPAVSIVDDHGWRLANKQEGSDVVPISQGGQALVVNHNELKALGLVNDSMSPEKFRERFQPLVKEVPPPPVETLQGEPIAPSALNRELEKHILYHPSGPNTIGHISIDDRTNGINQSTWLYVKKALDYYKESKPIFVILELNTPGGEVYAAQLISDALKDLDTQYNIPVVAYINNWAISAGAMIAYSCRFIVTVKDGSMGAAEPLMQNAEGKMEPASEKINSALRADFANRARFFERDPLIAEAMVDKEIILVQRYGKVIKLDSSSQIRESGQDPDILISPKGKLLTLDAKQMLQYGVADMLIPPTKTSPITAEQLEKGKWPAETMSLFHQPFFDRIPEATVDAFRMDWKMRFFALLASPVVSSLLLLGLTLGFYLEVSTPGFGLPGTVALTCLFLIVLSSFSLQIANWLELILLLVGLSVILVELFVLPTFGLLGFIGILLFIIGLFGMMLPGVEHVSFEFDTQTFNAAGEVFFERLAWLCGTLVAAFMIMVVLARYVTPSLSIFKRFVLHGNEQVGYIAVDASGQMPPPGTLGVALATLRPAGKVVINDTLYDAISTGPLIEKGEGIVVLGYDGGNLLVEPHGDKKSRKEGGVA